MPDKAKRKINPRRRWLFRMLIAIMLISIFVSVGMLVFASDSPQIVYIAPDDRGEDAIWLADLADPENPRQLLELDNEDRLTISYLDASEESDLIAYQVSAELFDEIWVYNLATEERILIVQCNEVYVCGSWAFHPGGRWLAYTLEVAESDDSISRYINVVDLKASDSFSAYQSEDDASSLTLQWLGETTILGIQIASQSDSSQLILYDVQDKQNADPISLNSSVWSSFYFSPDASQYITSAKHMLDDVLSSQTLSIWDMSDQTEALLEISADYVIEVLDWHPDSKQLLVYLETNLDAEILRDVRIYDTSTEESETVSIPIAYYETGLTGNFNYDGTQILNTTLSMIPDMYPIPQIKIYDLASRETTYLPLFGLYPQWLNGGR